MVQVGKVSFINAEKGTARVILQSNSVTTAELPIIYPFTYGNSVYYMPKINETVACVFVNKTQGFIIGSFYSQDRVPPIKDEECTYVKFEDGTLIKYDKGKGSLEIECIGDVNITCGGEFNVKSSNVNLS